MSNLAVQDRNDFGKEDLFFLQNEFQDILIESSQGDILLYIWKDWSPKLQIILTVVTLQFIMSSTFCYMFCVPSMLARSFVRKMSTRSKNTASANDIGRLLKAEGCLSESKYLHSDIEKVVENFADFMVAVLKFTPRPIESLFVRAAEDAFDKLEPGEAKAFASRMTAAFSYCRDKSRKMTTGKKLNAAVLKVCTAMLGKDNLPGRPASESKESLASRTSRSSTDGEVQQPLLHLKRPLPVRSPSPVQDRFSTPDRLSKLRREMSEAFGSLQSTIELPKSPIVIEESPVLAGRASSASRGSSDLAGSQHAPGDGPSKYVQYVDSAKLCVSRALPSGQVLEAVMEMGPHGFLVARFGDEDPFESEIPNALLAVKTAASKEPPVMRKPAAAPQKPKRKAKDRQPSPEIAFLTSTAEVEGEEKAENASAKTSHEEEGEEEGEEESEGSPDEEIDPDDETPASVAPDSLIFKGSMLKYVPAKKQSYIQEKIVVAGKNKLRLVVAVSETQSQKHKDVVKEIFEKLSKMKSFTKSKAVGLRTLAISSSA